MQSSSSKHFRSLGSVPEDFGPFTTVYTFNEVKEIRRAAIEETKKHCEKKIDTLVKEDGAAIATLQAVIGQLEQRLTYFSESNAALDKELTLSQTQYADACETSQELHLEIQNLRSLLKLATDTYLQVGAENKKLHRQLAAQHKDSSALEQMILDLENHFAQLSRDMEAARSISLVLDITVAQVSPRQQPVEEVEAVSPLPFASPAGNSRSASPAVNSRSASPAEVFEGEDANAAEGVLDENPADDARMRALMEENSQLKEDLIEHKFACQYARNERDLAKEEIYRLSGQVNLQDRVIDRLRHELTSAQCSSTESFQEQARACIELAQLREKYVALERELKIARSDCERLSDEKYQAISKNKHLDAAIKKLKNCKQQVKEQVKEEMQKQFKDFFEQCTTVSEEISGAGMALADEAFASQVKYYQETTNLAQRHMKVIEELRELRAVLAKGDSDEDVPLGLNLEEITRFKQLKRAVAENELLQDQLKTQHIFIHSTGSPGDDKLRHYEHCVELEGRITAIRNHNEELERQMAKLRRDLRDKDEALTKLRVRSQEGDKKLIATQSELARTLHSLRLSEQTISAMPPEGQRPAARDPFGGLVSDYDVYFNRD